MAEQKRVRAQVHTSPKGVAVFPWITKPDTRFNADGVYQTGLRLSEEDGQTVLALVSAEHDKNLVAVKAANKGKKIKEADLPIQAEIDEDGNENGSYLARFKLNAQFKQDDKIIKTAPAIFDAKGNKIELDALWGGSVIRVAFSMHPYYTATVGAGVSLRLRGVKALTLSAGNGGGADAFGFGEEEEGYEAETFESSGETKGNPKSDSDDAEDDEDF